MGGRLILPPVFLYYEGLDMARTTAPLVKGILLQDYDSKRNPNLQPFIDAASFMIDRVKSRAVENGYAVADSFLEMLERWVAAHGYCCSDQTYAQKKTLSSTGVYQGKTGLRLEGTKYGQYALTLDYTGGLEELNSSTVIKFTWLGKHDEDQTTYDQRNGRPTWEF